MTTMINSGKSLPQSLTEDSSAPGMPLPYRGQHPEDCTLRVAKRWSDIGFLNMRSWIEQLAYWERIKACTYPYNCDRCIDLENDFIYSRKQHALAMVNLQFDKAQAKKRELANLGPREFTLTYSQHWYDDDTDAQNAMRCAVEKLTRYYKDEIIEFHAIGEFTRAGRSHVHGWYNLIGGRKITDKNFKRAWKHWNPKRKLNRGFEGGHHETINRVSDFAGYTEKHLEEAWLEIHINNGSQEDNDSQEDHSSCTPQDDSPSSASDSESSESGRSEHV